MSNKQLPVRSALVAALLAGLCLATAPAALAGKGGPKPPPGTSSISLVLLNSSDGLAHYGQTVTFNVSTTQTSEPWVNLKCYQDGALVAQGYNGYFDRSITGRNFGLYSPAWTGGAADCTADLLMRVNDRWKQLASTSFHVDA